jgi:DNA invertase Pin-like site-specific DNA recombinase
MGTNAEDPDNQNEDRTMTEVISYTRYSPRPVKDGDEERAAAQEDAESIQLQMEMNQRYAAMKGLAITEVIKDPETSARKTRLFDREGGSRLQFLPKGSHVICMRLDRMFRSTVDGLQASEFFQKKGIVLHFADQSGCTLDLSTGEGRFMFTILLSAAEFEPHRTADRTSKGMKHRQKNGQRMTSKQTVPFGQRVDPNDDSRTIRCEVELLAAEEARALCEYGMSLRKIAEAIGPIRGKILSPQSVKNLMKAIC